MRLPRILLVAAAAALLWFGNPSSQTAQAEDDPVKFLHALQESGYPDIAVDYLKAIKDQPDAPKEILDVWDLEMSRSLRAAAKLAYDEKEAKAKTDQAQEYLQKFIKEKPDHPEAVKEDAKWADLQGQEALREMQRAKGLTDQKQKAEALEKARKLLEEVRPRFVKAQGKFKAKLASMTRPAEKQKMSPGDRKKLDAWLDTEGELIETELKIAITDFYLAQTIADPANPQRKTALEKAGKAFDKIFQDNRENFYGMHAHFMHARTMHELGDLDLAMEIYDEVMAGAPEIPSGGGRTPRPKLTGDERLFAEVQQYRLQILLQPEHKKRSIKDCYKDYYREAKQWLEPQYEPYYLMTDGYQGILFDFAKFNLEMAAKTAVEANKNAYTSEAIKALKRMRKIPSQYLAEAKRKLKEMGVSDADAGLDDLLAEADEAAKQGAWARALEKCEKALELAQKPTAGRKPDAKKVLLVRTYIAECYYQMAGAHFAKGELEECKRCCRVILKEYRDIDVAPKAADRLLTASTNEYATAAANYETAKAEYERAKAAKDDEATQAAQEKKDEAEKQRDATKNSMITIAKAIINLWPGKPEADSARLAQGRIEVYAQNLPAAMKIFEEINPKSPHYATAWYLAGLTNWRKYVEGRKQIDWKKANNQALEADEEKKTAEFRQQAVKHMTTAQQTAKDLPPDKTGRMPRQAVDAFLLLAEMKAEGGEAKEAALLFQPLVEDMKKAGAENQAARLDPTTLRILNGAIKTLLQTNEVDKASEVAAMLIKMGDDVPQVNIVLVDFAKRLDGERKAVEKLRDAETGDTRTKLSDKITGYEKMLRDLLKNLGGREKVSIAGMNWTADACISLGMSDQGEQLLNKILEQIENDPDPKLKKAKLGILVKLISVLRKKDKLDDALIQVNKLEDEAPNALPPMMEKGHILQALAEKTPEKYQEAVDHWDRVRKRLEKVKVDKRPPEYFEVILCEGQCFLNWAKKSGDKSHAKNGEQLIRQLIMFSPEIPAAQKTRLLDLADKLCTQQGNVPPKREKPEPAKKTTGKK